MVHSTALNISDNLPSCPLDNRHSSCILFMCVFLWFIFSFFLIVAVTVKWLAVKTAPDMTYTVSGGALNSAQSNPCLFCVVSRLLVQVIVCKVSPKLPCVERHIKLYSLSHGVLTDLSKWTWLVFLLISSANRFFGFFATVCFCHKRATHPNVNIRLCRL